MSYKTSFESQKLKKQQQIFITIKLIRNNKIKNVYKTILFYTTNNIFKVLSFRQSAGSKGKEMSPTRKNKPINLLKILEMQINA